VRGVSLARSLSHALLAALRAGRAVPAQSLASALSDSSALFRRLGRASFRGETQEKTKQRKKKEKELLC